MFTHVIGPDDLVYICNVGGKTRELDSDKENDSTIH